MGVAELMVATKHQVEEIFDGAAERYDREGPPLFREWGAHLIELLGFAGGERVLDVATGTGAVLAPAMQRVGRFGRVVGVDLSQNMLDEAERVARAQDLDNFELYKMDAERLEFRDGIFDGVTCAFSLFFFHDLAAALREMHRVLRPGGHIGVAVFGDAPPPFDPGWRIFAEQARAYGGAIRTPQRVVYTPVEMQTVLASAGFGEIKTALEKYDVVFASLDAWWAFQLTLGNRATILQMADAVRAKFQAEYFDKLRPLLRQDGLHLGVSVVYAAGTAESNSTLEF